jgi:hypothetical protein
VLWLLVSTVSLQPLLLLLLLPAAASRYHPLPPPLLLLLHQVRCRHHCCCWRLWWGQGQHQVQVLLAAGRWHVRCVLSQPAAGPRIATQW